MSEERYVAAIEISSSKIIGTVGIPRPEGTLEVIAVEQERCLSFVRMGFIQNIDETAFRVRRLLEKLQKKNTVAPRKITKVFIGLSGRSMRSIPVLTETHIPEDSTVDDKILETLREQARHMPLDNSLELIDCVPRSFFIDKRETREPKGSVGNKIEATYDLVVCRPELKRNILRTFEKVPEVTLEGFIVTAMATGQIILNNEEKQLGCMLVDMGAETTTVSIYRHGSLYYYETLPMGSRNITRDITTLKVSEERAEDIKITSGNAIAPENPSVLDYHGVKQSEISELVVARAEEICANIIAQIDYAGLTNSDLPSGIILIGGGAKLNGMVDLLGNQSYLNVRRGEFPPYITIVDTKVPTSETIEVVSVLYAAATNTDVNCLERAQQQSIPENGEEEDWEDEDYNRENTDRKSKKQETKTRKPGGIRSMFSKIGNSLGSIFTTPEDEDDTEID